MSKMSVAARAYTLVMILFASAASAKMQITSSAFANGAPIPSKYTCDAQMPPNPPLAFSGVPAKAQSLVLIMEDRRRAQKPDAQRGL